MILLTITFYFDAVDIENDMEANFCMCTVFFNHYVRTVVAKELKILALSPLHVCFASRCDEIK